VYLDDVIIFSQNEKEHVAHVDEVLQLLGQAGVSLKLKKCRWFQPKVDYLGHVVMPGKLAIASDGTKSIRGAVFPQGLTQLRSFLGACNVYRKFVEGFSKLAKPLNDMLKKGAEPDWQHPSEKQMQAFNSLKEALKTPPVLALPKNGRPYMVDTDASNHAIGAVLLQQQDDEHPKEWVPIGYWSKTFTQQSPTTARPNESVCL
jgi:hypothetical protein